jgi:hypothetical protein
MSTDIPVHTTTSLVADADVLIKLAQHPANLAAISAISNAVDRGTYTLIVPEPVLNAFNREKVRAAENFWNTQRGTIRNLRLLRDVFSQPEEISALADRLTTELEQHSTELPNTIKAVEELLAKGRSVGGSDAMKVSSAERVAQYKAPAKKAKNSSINDCIIWEIVKATSVEGELIFVTDNYKDFSDSEHRGKLHPELAAELPPGAKFCYHSLEDFQAKHMKQVQIVVPTSIELFPSFPNCLSCDSPMAPDKIPRPSMYGGWSYHQYCTNCGRYIDTGDPYDD